MADLATLSLVVDASGAKREIRLTTDELKKLANGGKEAAETLKRLGPSAGPQLAAIAPIMQNTARTTVDATRGITQLRGAMTVLAAQAVGLPGPLGRIASSLGLMGLGSPVMVGVLAGIAAVGLAWRALTVDSRAQREENEKVKASFLDMENSLSLSARRVRESLLIRQEAELSARVAQGPAGFGRGVGMERFSGIVAMQNFERLKAQLAEVRERLSGTSIAIRKLIGDEASAAFQKASEAVKKLREELLKTSAAMVTDAMGGLRLAEAGLATVGITDTTERDRQLSIARAQLQAVKDSYAIEQQRKIVGDKAADAAQAAVARALELKITTADITAEEARALDLRARSLRLSKEQEESEKRRRDILKGMALGAAAGVLGAVGGTAGGIAAGVLQGGLSGAAGGVVGIAAGASIALVAGLFGLSKAAADARKAVQALSKSFYDDLVQRERDLEGFIATFSPTKFRFLATTPIPAFTGFKGVVDQLRDLDKFYVNSLARLKALNAGMEENAIAVGRLNAIVKEAVEAILAEEAARQQAMQDDLEVRRLRGLGMDEEAQALAFALAQQREYAQAVKDGANATTLAALAEVLRIEKLNEGIAKAQAKIDSYTATIAGLEDFRNTLLLGDAKLSPTERLKEAKRQYDEILAITQGDDITKAQGAAGRLPAAAQALLSASGVVNASGAEFQSDLKKVLADTAATIARFQDLRTIEEEMRDYLKDIRDHTGAWEDVITGPGWEYPFTPPGGVIAIPVVAQTDIDIEKNTKATVAALQAGYTDTLVALGLLAGKIDEGTTAMKRVAGDLAAVL